LGLLFKKQAQTIQLLQDEVRRHHQFWEAVGKPIKKRKLDTDYFTARGRFAKLIADLFTMDELELICFNLGNFWTDLTGVSLLAKSQGLVEHFQNRHQMYKLIDELQRHRPGVEWPMI